MVITEAQKFWLESDFVLELLKQIPASVFWKDKDSVYLGCNDAFANSLGLSSPAEIIGKTDYDLPTTKEESDAFRADDKQVIESRKPKLNIEEYQTLTDGRSIALLTNKVPLFDQQNQVIGILGIYHDITERKKIEEDLKKAIQSKSEFLEVMSHDLRGPFNNILCAAEIAKMYLKSGKPIQKIEEYLDIIPNEINRSLDLLNNVNFLLELNDGKIQKGIVSINITNTIKTILSDYQVSPSINITINSSPSVPQKIKIDAMNLYLALKIIISNALRFTNEGSVKIIIDLDNANNLCVEVIDTGCGMTLEQQKNIFKAFLTEEDYTERSHLRKPGLKLVIAKKIIELMGGTFIIKSKPGLGTTVKVSAPFKTVSVNRQETSPLVTKKLVKRDDNILSFSILLVEGDAISIELETLALESLNQRVTKATTGRQAIELAQTTKFDIIFLDITLPDIDGVEVAFQVRERWGDDITIVAVTSHVLEKDISLFTRHGMMAVIPKPASYSIFKQFLIDYTYALQHIDD